MDSNKIVLLLDTDDVIDEAEASAYLLAYRRLLDEVLGGSTEPLPFPVLRPAVRNDPELLLRLIEDLEKRFGSILVVVPESGSARRRPIDLPAGIDWLSFADQSQDILALLQRQDMAPSRGAPMGPLSSSWPGTPSKGGGFGGHYSMGVGKPSAPSSGGDKVFTGVSVPPSARPGRTFTASFAAYTEAHRAHVRNILRSEAPKSGARLDLDKGLWRPGARVRVDLAADGCVVTPPSQTFTWDGTWEILRFDVELEDDYDDENLTLRFDVVVEEMTIRRLRPQIEVGRDQEASSASTFTEDAVPGDAFASYSTKDKSEVLGRVRSLQINTRMDIFLDRTDLVPGDVFEQVIEREIRKRELFYLFWSRNAKDSEWVDREWRLALQEEKPIEPHPLDTTAPPAKLAHLQFGSGVESQLERWREEAGPAD